MQVADSGLHALHDPAKTPVSEDGQPSSKDTRSSQLWSCCSNIGRPLLSSRTV